MLHKCKNCGEGLNHYSFDDGKCGCGAVLNDSTVIDIQTSLEDNVPVDDVEDEKTFSIPVVFKITARSLKDAQTAVENWMLKQLVTDEELPVDTVNVTIPSHEHDNQGQRVIYLPADND